ncbi:MAG: serine acetyltransferase [Pirellulales bacterium]
MVTTEQMPNPIGRADWGIDDIVRQLRTLRDASLAERRAGRTPIKLPSRRVLADIVDGLAAAMFPNRLGRREQTNESIDYFVGRTLDLALGELAEQVERELRFETADESPASRFQRAAETVRRFAAELPELRRLLDLDSRAVFEGDPAARNIDEVLACYPGMTAVIHHRLAHVLLRLGAPLVARMIAELAHAVTGIDIHPGAVIGESFFIDHGTGVVIGETAVIGDRVRLSHGVTLGAKSIAHRSHDPQAAGEPRHPILEDDVVVYANATILGRIRIGRGSVIGGNVWLTQSVPPETTITQAATRIEHHSDGSGI